MTEQNRLPHPHETADRTGRDGSSDLLRTTLWAVLVLGAVANVVASAAAAGPVVLVVTGVVTAAALAGLVAVWTKGRA